MDYFWFTKFTISEATGGEDVGFSLFSLEHFLELFVALAIFVGVAFLYKKASEKTRKIILIVIAILLVADELFKHIACLILGQWRVEFLPLQLCSINIFVILFYVIKPKQALADWLYATSMPGAFIAMLLPSWRTLPILNFMRLHSYLAHILLVLFPLLLIVGGIRPNIKNLKYCAIGLVGVSIPIFILNKVWNTNFFFLNTGDPTSPLVIFQNENFLWGYGYILVMYVALALVWTLLYLPWVLIEKKKLQTA